MIKCPYCNTPCNPLKLLFYSKWTKYSCPKCKELSEFKNSSMAIIVGIASGVLWVLYYFLKFQYGVLRSCILVFFIFAIIYPLLVCLFLELYPINKEAS